MHSAGILDEAWQLTIKQLTKARKDKRTTYNDYLILKQSLGDDKVAGIFMAAQSKALLIKDQPLVAEAAEAEEEDPAHAADATAVGPITFSNGIIDSPAATTLVLNLVSAHAPPI